AREEPLVPELEDLRAASQDFRGGVSGVKPTAHGSFAIEDRIEAWKHSELRRRRRELPRAPVCRGASSESCHPARSGKPCDGARTIRARHTRLPYAGRDRSGSERETGAARGIWRGWLRWRDSRRTPGRFFAP